MTQLVLVRHGQSLWNAENRFTGWVDVGLSPKGEQEAQAAGKLLKANNFSFTQVHSSLLKRAIWTSWLILNELDQVALPILKSWRLNERHYGDLQGKNKQEMRDEFGEEQVHTWRRSFDTPPPKGSGEPLKYPFLCSELETNPQGESLKDTCERVLPYWEKQIIPELKNGEKILIAAHGNSLRALVKHLKGIPDEEITKLEIPTGQPLICELDSEFKVTKDFYLE